jgi:hypothetical protein
LIGLITYHFDVLLGLRSPLGSHLFKLVGRKTETHKVVVLNILGLLEVKLSSLEIIISILRGWG